MNAEGEAMNEDELAELAAFADGTIAPEDRERVAAKIESSPGLQAFVERQRSSIVAVAALDSPAPPELHESVAAALPDTVSPTARRRRLPRFRLAAGFSAVAAACAVVAVVVLGGTASPTVAQTAELAERSATSPAPAVDPADPNMLTASVSGVPFPNYEEAFGWVQTGERSDDAEGRESRTVFYERGDQEIAYSIVGGEPLEWPGDDTTVTERDGVEFHQFVYDGRNVVTWLRGGQTCVLSGDQVSRSELIALASWMGESSEIA